MAEIHRNGIALRIVLSRGPTRFENRDISG